MEAAAVALITGCSDILGFLGKAGDDWLIQLTVLEKADRIAQERRIEEIKASAKAIGITVANEFARLLRKS